jgi:hypothetical protein
LFRPALNFRPNRGFAAMIGDVLHVSGIGRFLKSFGRFSVDTVGGSYEKGRGGPILCISYTLRGVGSITFDTVKIDDLDCERLFRLLNNSASRSMVKISESCTTGGTTQITNQWLNGNMLVLWRNDVERKIVMISLQRPASRNGNFKRIECERAKRLDAGDASRARFPQHLGVDQSHVVASILFANALAQRSYAATRKLSPKSRRAFRQKKETIIMYMTQEQPNQTALPTDKCASALGMDEFSLLTRIQTGDIKAVRARSGEIMIPETELERLVPAPLRAPPDEFVNELADLSDRRMGIESRRGLRLRGVEPMRYYVPGHSKPFVGREIEGYRAAFGAIAKEIETANDFAKQLHIERQFPQSDDMEIDTPQTGQWEVGEALLNLKRGEILLCRRGDEFAVIERFDQDSPYAQAKGQAEILLQGNDANQLADEFKANAQRTLKFMASNATAKAQKIVWGQFYEQKPDEIMAAISERCHQAVANQETISLKMTQSIKRGMSV